MAVGTLSPVPWWTILDANGNPIPGALVYTYLAGTSTPVATYTDVGLTVPNANPIVCDSAGRCVVFLSPGVSYKFVVQTASGAAVRTQDNISAVPGSSAGIDVVGVAGESLLANNCVYQSDGEGGATVAGRWYKADSNFVAKSVIPLVGFVTGPIAAGSTASIRLQGQLTGFLGLTPGAVYYVFAPAGTISTSAPANLRRIGQADSTTVLNVSVGTPLSTLPTVWTPTDASGAGLVFAASPGSWTLVTGRLVFISVDVTYPATASGALATIGGLSVGALSPRTFGLSVGVSTFPTMMYLAVIGTQILIEAPGGVQLTNAQMSGQIVRGSGTYLSN